MELFNFIKHPFESLHDYIQLNIPGIEKIVTIYYSRNSQKWTGHLSENKKGAYEIIGLDLREAMPIIKKYTEEKHPYVWQKREDFPFDLTIRKQNPELDIFSEFENVVLVIRIPDEETQMNSLVIIYLNENPSNFGLANSSEPLTTDHKSIIAYYIRQSLITEIRRHKENLSILKTHNQNIKNSYQTIENLRHDIYTIKENFGVRLVQMCDHYLLKYTRNTNKKYKFSKSAINEIKNYSGELQQLQKVIRNTVVFLENLYFDKTGEIMITDLHVQFDDPGSLPVETDSGELSTDKYGKTIQLLNKLEEAALKVKNTNRKMTGTLVGKSCRSPITHAAISESLYNHRFKIKKLVALYPERWSTIRSEFRPFMNILKKVMIEE